METTVTPSFSEQHPTETASRKLTFSGTASEYFRIWVVNTLLTIVTLGIYSAWAKVRTRKYLYGATTLDGSPFDYTADPLKILKGRIIVVVLYFLLTLISGVIPVFALILPLGMIALLPWMLNASAKFNAVNTLWRGVRFNFSSTYGNTAGTLFLPAIATLITGGLAFPWLAFSLKKVVGDNSMFGTERFRYNGKAGSFFSLYIIVVLLSIVFMVIIYALTLQLLAVAHDMPRPFVMLGLPTLAIILFSFTTGYLRGGEFLLFAGNLSLSGHTVRCSLNKKKYARLWVSFVLMTLISLGLLAPLGIIRLIRYRVESITIESTESLDAFVGQQAENINSLGEELTDFFDIDFGL